MLHEKIARARASENERVPKDQRRFRCGIAERIQHSHQPMRESSSAIGEIFHRKGSMVRWYVGISVRPSGSGFLTAYRGFNPSLCDILFFFQRDGLCVTCCEGRVVFVVDNGRVSA